MRRDKRYWFNLLKAFVLASLAGLVVIIVELSRRQAHALVHPRRSPVTSSPAVHGLSYEEVSFPSADGVSLKGWLIPPQNGAVVILAHGSGANRQAMLPHALILHRHGYGALLFDFRAHGESGGRVFTYGYEESKDIVGAAAYLRSRGDVDGARIGAWGVSLGATAVVLAAARTQHIKAVAAEAGFASLEELMRESFSASTGFPFFPFGPITAFFAQREAGVTISQVRPVDQINRIAPRPVLIVHGTEDEVVPVNHALQLYQAAGDPKELWLVEGAGHADILSLHPQEYEARIIAFFDRALKGGK